MNHIYNKRATPTQWLLNASLLIGEPHSNPSTLDQKEKRKPPWWLNRQDK